MTRARDHVSPGPIVEVGAQRVHECLGDILDHRETAGHVAVERGVAGCHLTLVPGREHHPPELVRDGHEHVAADARLYVLLGQARPRTFEHRCEHRLESCVRGLDRHGERFDPEALRERRRVGNAVLARIARRHEHAEHVLGPERVDRDRGDERRIDPARKADQHVVESVLAHVVAGAQHERLVDLAHRRQRRLDARGTRASSGRRSETWTTGSGNASTRPRGSS